MMNKKKRLLIIISIGISVLCFLLSSNLYERKKENRSHENEKQEISITDQVKTEKYKKGYNLPIKKEDKKRAKNDCLDAMKLIEKIYQEGGFADFDNTILSKKTQKKMMKQLKQMKQPLMSSSLYFNMIYYKKMEHFISQVKRGMKTKAVLYQLQIDGGIGRSEFTYDGKDIYLLYTNAIWNEKRKPVLIGSSYTRIKEWSYTKKGWFIYELCVPEAPEVTELVDGIVMFRVKPIKPKYREVNECFLIPIGYQGNNFLSCNWNKTHMEKIDYNALFERFTLLKSQKEYQLKQYTNGVPEYEFEQLFIEFLPVTKEQLRTYSAYDKKQHVYGWISLDSANFMPNELGQTVPEIVDIKENKDGTSVLTIDAVCYLFGLDQLFQHKLKVRFLENGRIKFISNQVIEKGQNWIPEYQFRIPKD